ncbi:MAG TPA: FliG C-terminal domain-containing protein [Bacteriovoracaceae bacterium]|nr:FliG C-terminal domain-containing protein [Bacteriovoracaceae bacterium]
MNKRIDGFKHALEMLQGLDQAAQTNLLAEIARKDPEMAIKLKQNLITFEDLKYLTVDMMRSLLKEIDLELLGLALKTASPDLVEYVCNMFSTSMRRDIEEILKGRPRPLSEVLEAQVKIVQVMTRLQDEGVILIDKDKSSEWV